MNQAITHCPSCQQKGRIAPDLIGQPVRCPDCGQTFTASPSFWQRQKMSSPIFRYWWLLPVIILALCVYLGGLPIWIAAACVIIALLGLILHRLTLIAKSK